MYVDYFDLSECRVSHVMFTLTTIISISEQVTSQETKTVTIQHSDTTIWVSRAQKRIDRLPFKVHIFDFTTLILSQSLTNPVWIGAATLCAFFLLESLKINAGWHMWEQQHYCSWRLKRIGRGGFLQGGGSEAMRITFGSYCDVRSFAWHRHWKLRIVNIVKWRHKNWLVILRHISWRATLTTSKAADDSNKKAHELLPNSMT